MTRLLLPVVALLLSVQRPPRTRSRRRSAGGRGLQGRQSRRRGLIGIVAEGDQARFPAAMAPRPLMLWAPTEDIGMPREAVDAFVAGVSPAYEQAGAPEAFVVHQPPGEHTFSLEAFEAMERLFARHLGARSSVSLPASPEAGDEP